MVQGPKRYSIVTRPHSHVYEAKLLVLHYVNHSGKPYQ